MNCDSKVQRREKIYHRHHPHLLLLVTISFTFQDYTKLSIHHFLGDAFRECNQCETFYSCPESQVPSIFTFTLHTFHSSEYALEKKQHSQVLRAFSSCNRSNAAARLALEKLSTSFSSLTAAAVCCVRTTSTAAKAKPLLVEINFKMKIHEFHFAFGGFMKWMWILVGWNDGLTFLLP